MDDQRTQIVEEICNVEGMIARRVWEIPHCARRILNKEVAGNILVAPAEFVATETVPEFFNDDDEVVSTRYLRLTD
ncbi:hypothetical protein [Pseudofrankia sp. BMG5.36]|uniref:hypothetical protein n=1 Tax=Pseudofrankia sp. BMG5.36 TaxID=1834512 RepID=UPI0010425132|nr:hypothetical protein [Pseudofrankia sp. BMG5.36]